MALRHNETALAKVRTLLYSKRKITAVLQYKTEEEKSECDQSEREIVQLNGIKFMNDSDLEMIIV